MKKTMILLTLAALVAAPLGAPAFAADEAKEAAEQFEDRMKDADEATKVRLIQQLATDHPESKAASKAISKFTRDRSQAVQVAAIRALGSYKDRKYLGTFMGLMKMYEDNPKVLSEAILALGELGEKRTAEEFIDLARKWLPKNALVASAAATALGNCETKESVDELIGLLDLTYPRQAQDGPAISQETRKTLADSRPAIMKALSNLTGWEFGDPRAWNNFWDSQQRRWKPGKGMPDMTEAKEWEDPGYGFEIEKPEKRWIFQPAEGCRVSLTRGEENLMQAMIYVQAYDMANYTSMTPEQKAAAKEDEYRKSYKDIKEESWIREPFRVGREKGYMHSFTGLSGSGSVLRVKNIYVVKDEFMYVIGSWVRSGSPEELIGEVDEALESFRFTRD